MSQTVERKPRPPIVVTHILEQAPQAAQKRAQAKQAVHNAIGTLTVGGGGALVTGLGMLTVRKMCKDHPGKYKVQNHDDGVKVWRVA